MIKSSSAFQVIPPVVRDIGNGYEIDEDFLFSLEIYLKYFDKFTVACPVFRGDTVGSGLAKCVPIADLTFGKEQFEFIPLPLIYNPISFLRLLPKYSGRIRAEVAKADYLIFTPYSATADWPTIAVREAIRLGKPYTIEADGVHGDQNRRRFLSDVFWKRAIQRYIIYPQFDRKHRYFLNKSALGIFQGRDVYNAYAPHCSNALELNHHIPIYPGDHISEEMLDSKIDDVASGARLKICYAGRSVDMKGPLHWVDTLAELANRGVRFEANWLGDGPMLDAMRQRVSELGVPNVNLPGFVSDRGAMLQGMKDAHIFMFCHTTLESARILGEALACGAPLVGFRTAYPEGLVEENGGGIFCDMLDTQGLADLVQGLDDDREALGKLIAQAARTGRGFDRIAALKERAAMVKQMGGSKSTQPAL